MAAPTCNAPWIRIGRAVSHIPAKSMSLLPKFIFRGEWCCIGHDNSIARLVGEDPASAPSFAARDRHEPL
jgi:hypothetical protein